MNKNIALTVACMCGCFLSLIYFANIKETKLQKPETYDNKVLFTDSEGYSIKTFSSGGIHYYITHPKMIGQPIVVK